jgi:hypothetical protein
MRFDSKDYYGQGTGEGGEEVQAFLFRGGERVAVDFGRGLVGFVCFRWVTDGRAWRCAGRRWRVWFVTLVGEREVEGGTRPWMGAVKWMQTRWCERGKGRPYGGGIHGFTSRTWACKAYRPSLDWRRVRPGGGVQTASCLSAGVSDHAETYRMT